LIKSQQTTGVMCHHAIGAACCTMFRFN